MATNKHSKFKNTGIIFELLVRQIASDTLSGKECKAIQIMNEHFKKGTELNKELYLYNVILKEKFDSKEKAEDLIKTVIEQRKKLNQNDLRRQKYNVVKAIKDNYILEEFIKSKINNYKELAAIYKIFESSIGNISPVEIVTSKYTLIEHITNKKTDPKIKINELQSIDEFKKLDKDIRLLSYKKLLDSFNQKYKGLNDKQKSLLREYVNNVSDTVKLRKYITKEIPLIKKELATLSKSVDDKVIRIKLKEIANQLNVIKESTGSVKDGHIVALMKYYEICDELKKATNKVETK